MKLEILLSCMNQKNIAIVEKSCIFSDVLIINQCNENKEESYENDNQHIRMVSTTQRGLSRSRNMAIEYAQDDICLICDDDEEFVPGYEKKILHAFEELADADVIAFKMTNYPCGLKKKMQKLNFLKCLKISSWQIAFKLDSIKREEIKFDIYMGAGTGNGGGEEVKFLLDCLKKKLSLYYVPIEIASVGQQQSTWFFGYDKNFFYYRGVSTRYMLGLPLAVLYAFYYALWKRKRYQEYITAFQALGAMLNGIWKNDIAEQKLRRE